jgi:putative ABC transport system substrate-binding protein
MRRRDFIALCGSALAVQSGGAGAQTGSRLKVGFLSPIFATGTPFQTAAFLQGLKETGHVAGQNIEIEYRWGEDQSQKMPALAADLVKAKVDVIAAISTASVHAAQRATNTVPIVFVTGDDPIRARIVENLNRPTANMTGVSFNSSVLGAKRLELFRALVPQTGLIAVLHDPNAPESATMLHDLQEAAQVLKQSLLILGTSGSGDFDKAFASMAQQKADVFIVCGSPLFNAERRRIVGLAERYKLAGMFTNRNFAEAGGLVSYGASIPDAYRQAGNYVGRILKGERPSDLPILLPTKFDLVINLKTAKALGLQISDRMMALSDEVIE